MLASDPDPIRLANAPIVHDYASRPIHLDELSPLIEHTSQAAARFHWLYAH
jgi:hypothetical protein